MGYDVLLTVEFMELTIHGTAERALKSPAIRFCVLRMIWGSCRSTKARVADSAKREVVESQRLKMTSFSSWESFHESKTTFGSVLANVPYSPLCMCQTLNHIRMLTLFLRYLDTQLFLKPQFNHRRFGKLVVTQRMDSGEKGVERDILCSC